MIVEMRITKLLNYAFSRIVTGLRYILG